MTPLRPRRLLAALLAVALLPLSAHAAGSPVEQWGIFELTLTGPAEGNPFVEVDFAATFTQGDRAVPVTGFYDGAGIYKVRFSPETTGEWRYVTRSNRPVLHGQTGSFTASPPAAGNHGPVRVANTFHFAHADGTPYRQLGTTSYSWIHQTEDRMAQTLRTLAGAPFNKIRMCVFPQNNAASTLRFFPFEGTPPRDWDTARFNPAFFQNLEQRVGQLRDLGIEADLILFHPYGETWPFSSMDAASDDRYVRYVVARLSAYRNVWWSLCNEWDFLKSKTEADWDRLFQVIQAADAHARLRSIHNGFVFYNNTHPWVTHASIQHGVAPLDPERAMVFRDVWRKPVVFDEVRYEGNHHRRWGRLTGEELVLRFWNGTVAGTYVGHSEILGRREPAQPGDRPAPDRRLGYWLTSGGELRGESAPRLAFLKRILDESPAAGIDPIDKWQDWRLGGQPGEYYLLYLGEKAPTEWRFLLPRHGLVDGMKFSAEIIDTWNMTITPVDGAFTIKRRDDYTFVERDGRDIPLPGRAYLTIRLRRIGDAPAGPKEPDREL
jgi:hypothetical protein